MTVCFTLTIFLKSYLIKKVSIILKNIYKLTKYELKIATHNVDGPFLLLLILVHCLFI